MLSSGSMRDHVGIIDHLIRPVWADRVVRLVWALHPPFDPLQGVGTVSFASHCLLLISPVQNSRVKSELTDVVWITTDEFIRRIDYLLSFINERTSSAYQAQPVQLLWRP
jgi:hypothetical protein